MSAEADESQLEKLDLEKLSDMIQSGNRGNQSANATIVLTKMALELQIVINSMYPLIFLLGLLGNTMVIVVVLKNAKMRNATNYLVMALAIADLLFIVLCVPYTLAAYTFDGYAFGDSKFMCKIPNYMIFVTCLCSVYTLVLSKSLTVLSTLLSLKPC